MDKKDKTRNQLLVWALPCASYMTLVNSFNLSRTNFFNWEKKEGRHKIRRFKILPSLKPPPTKLQFCIISSLLFLIAFGPKKSSSKNYPQNVLAHVSKDICIWTGMFTDSIICISKGLWKKTKRSVESLLTKS